MRRLSRWSWALVFVVIGVAGLTGANAQTPSTLEERQRMVRVTRELENDPLTNDAGLLKERNWALQWLTNVPDVRVKMCSKILTDFLKAKYKYSPALTLQFTFSSAAFVIENPTRSGDQVAQDLAGVVGMLKAYNAILKNEPKETSKMLDDLLQKQNDGKLEEFVRESAKGCK